MANWPWFFWPGLGTFVLIKRNTMITTKQVGEAIIRLRKIRGLSQEKFALEAGIDRRYLSDIENGKRNFSFDLLLRVASFFQVSVSSFIAEAEQNPLFKDVTSIRDFLSTNHLDGFLMFENPDFSPAVVGYSHEGLIYSYQRMTEILILNYNKSREEAAVLIEEIVKDNERREGGILPIVMHNNKN